MKRMRNHPSESSFKYVYCSTEQFSLELVHSNLTIDIFQFKFTTINLLFYTLKLNFN